MDFSKFKTSDWLKVGGGVAILIGYFLDWTSFPCDGLEGIPGAKNACDSSNFSGSEFLFRGTLPWLLVLAVAVLTVLLAGGMMKAGSTPWGLIFMGATGLATLLVFIYVIHPTYSGVSGIGRGIGSLLSLAGAAAALGGSVQGFTESGGSLSDLKDMNKMKSQFGGGGGTPPPPPPGMPPPPPPR